MIVDRALSTTSTSGPSASLNARPPVPSDLVDVLMEAGLSDRLSTESAVDTLITYGVLVEGCPGSDGHYGTRDNPIVNGGS